MATISQSFVTFDVAETNFHLDQFIEKIGCLRRLEELIVQLNEIGAVNLE